MVGSDLQYVFVQNLVTGPISLKGWCESSLFPFQSDAIKTLYFKIVVKYCISVFKAFEIVTYDGLAS